MSINDLTVKKGKKAVKNSSFAGWSVAVLSRSLMAINDFAFVMLRQFFIFIGFVVCHIALKVKIVGRRNVPKNEALMVVSNHFSWFDAPLLAIFLPFQPTFLVATESQKKWYVRFFLNIFGGIPIWRGQVDRKALRSAAQVLNNGGRLGIFPEGGIDPGVAAKVARGEVVPNIRNHASRISAELVQPRSGIALLTSQTDARILPVALIGTELIMGNIFNFRRTPVTIKIGEPFKAIEVDPELQGREKRQRLDEVANGIMREIAYLFPNENRGPYRDQDVA